MRHGAATDHEERLRARVALEGLSVGDAFGERFFVSPATVDGLIEQRAGVGAVAMDRRHRHGARRLRGAREPRCDDHRDALATVFARRYWLPFSLGFVDEGVPWSEAATTVLRGEGSMGNGAAMRVAPVGAYFADDLDAVVAHAAASADPTHAHPDGRAGAIAVAVATAIACRDGAQALASTLFDEVLARTPDGPTRDGLAYARRLGLDVDVRTAVTTLGNGSLVIASDTVPLSVWAAARHLHDYEEAMWTTVAALGDRDTTCAVVGGIVASTGASIPEHFLRAREPLSHP